MTQCEHIHGDGTRCFSPAMHRRPFCYMHWRLREHQLPIAEPEFHLPTIDSEASIVLATSQVANAVLSGQLDSKRARVVLACLKMAVDSMRRQQDVTQITELELTPAMREQFALEALAKREHQLGTGNRLGTGAEEESETALERTALETTAHVGTKTEVATKAHVGPGALARAGGASAPRSLPANEASSSQEVHQSDEAPVLDPPSPTAPPLSSRARRSEARDLLFAHLTPTAHSNVPSLTEEDLERFIDQHPLMKLKPPTLAEIAGSM